MTGRTYKPHPPPVPLTGYDDAGAEAPDLTSKVRGFFVLTDLRTNERLEMSFTDVLETIPLVEPDDDFRFALRVLACRAVYLAEHQAAEWIPVVDLVDLYNSTAPVQLPPLSFGRRLGGMGVKSDTRRFDGIRSRAYRVDSLSWARLELACERFSACPD
jgi:hypothetical protein